MVWLAQAPSNIALIKYMGKKDQDQNLPDNPSLSYTLNNLLSTVELETLPGQKDFWEPLLTPGSLPFELSLTAQQRFLNHLQRLKSYFGYQGGFIVRSCNNFPLASGLASSASSFAALTRCAVRALCELTQSATPPMDIIAGLSRQGSGSSCRSFFSPWALWEGSKVTATDLPYSQLIHQVIIISHQEKSVPSSQAHKRVQSSADYKERPDRASQNLKRLLQAMHNKDWSSCYQICWDEFQDMHQLFESASPPFGYITAQGQEVLDVIAKHWEKVGDGPIVTMDAGPNIHLLYREDQFDMANKIKIDNFLSNYDVL